MPQRDAMSDGVFDEAVAHSYDDDVAEMFAAEVLGPTVDFLEACAGATSALEFAVGTGRVALALKERGVAVSGLEMSRAMVQRLRAKPGGEDLPVVIGDMTSTHVEGEFGLVYLVFNTIGNLLTADEQVACFRNAAAHLDGGGLFVIEIGLPQLRKLPVGERFVAFKVDGGYAGIDEYDVVDQLLTSHHFNVNADGTGGLFETPQRYVWPSELDLMARLAGMRLRERWADFHRNPFTAESTSHVSVYEKVSEGPY
jgi:SAM-dependent methyltransferase